jgi:hypothetical protein
LEIKLTLEEKGKSRPFSFTYTRMVNAGYVGRNQEEVRRHIDELAEKGIPGPETTPTLYPVVCKAMVTDSEIEVYGHKTSGEVEYVLLVASEKEVYVGLGSDHTDRHLEELDIPRAKQICPNVISQKVWPLAEVENHWDDLIIRSKVVKGGNEVLYQEGRLALILNPAELTDFVRSKVPGPLENIVIYSGTLGMLTGEFVFGERFSAELVDERLNRRLDLSYEIRPIDYMAVE